MKVLFWAELEMKEWKKNFISNKAAKTNENNENLKFQMVLIQHPLLYLQNFHQVSFPPIFSHLTLFLQ